MAAPPPFERLRRILLEPKSGVVGLVNDLLTVCRELRLDLDWRPDCYRVRSVGGEWEELSGVRLHRSVFRGLLARIAVLFIERTPALISAYGDRGELPVGGDPPMVFCVSFVNTAADQKLELTIATDPDAG